MARASDIVKTLPVTELDAQLETGKFPSAQVYVAEYNDGRWLGRGWARGANAGEAVERAIAAARSGALETRANCAVIVVPFDRESLTRDNQQRRLSDVHRGVRGVGFEYGGELHLASPSEAIVRNIPLKTQLEQLAEAWGRDANALIQQGRAFTYAARQFHVQYGSQLVARELLRGNGLVPVEAVRKESVQEFEADLSSWMVRNVRETGRVTYLYHPSRGSEDSEHNNMVRQAMASICLGRIASRKPTIDVECDVQALAKRNLRHNLLHYYKSDDEKGWIEDEREKMAYLGSTSLMLLAILESSIRGELLDEERGLRAGVDFLFDSEEGSFRMFYFPEDETRGQNYFPGETLLAWATSVLRDPNDELLEKIFRSYRYYRTWHLENRNPAFVPWHTQAYKKLLEVRDSSELRGWIFEMNDWLLTMQDRSMVVYPDTLGRFYDPTRPFGPPHASSTGVYLEGLVDAFQLARDANDDARTQAYRRSIVLGLRSAMQLQFVDDVDMFYVSDREFVRGGLRTTVYDNRIRVDNVQHVLMAVQKILDVFSAEDFVVES